MLSTQYVTVYGRGTLSLTEQQVAAFNQSALPTLIVVIGGIAISLVGISELLSAWREPGVINSVLDKAKVNVSRAISRRHRIFWLGLAFYAVFLLFSSGTVIVSQEPLSVKYGIIAPSLHITGCCGQPGEFPVVTVYATENLGLLIIPDNLLLLAFLPLLVGANLAYTVDQRGIISAPRQQRGKSLSVCGAATGFFAGCPTCATSLLPVMGGALAAFGISAASLVAFQPVFIVASFAALILAPVISESRGRR